MQFSFLLLKNILVAYQILDKLQVIWIKYIALKSEVVLASQVVKTTILQILLQ